MKLLNLKSLDPEIPEEGLIVGKTGFIITRSDFVHSIYPLEETVLFDVNGKWTPIGLESLLLYASEDIKLPEWGHYWGIKSRVQRNYALLKSSCREIETTETLPEWGAK